MSGKDNKNTGTGWIWRLADNGWADWICPNCNRRVCNDDIHVHLDWVYCPYCGALVEPENFKTLKKRS